MHTLINAHLQYIVYLLMHTLITAHLQYTVYLLMHTLITARLQYTVYLLMHILINAHLQLMLTREVSNRSVREGEGTGGKDKRGGAVSKVTCARSV